MKLRKQMAYDLIDMIESATDKDHYTPEEIKAMIKAYITGLSK